MEGSNADDGLSKAIGERFLLEYFKVASENTANLHKFYRKNAVCCFDDGTPVVGPAKIGEKLAVLHGAVFDLAKDGPICAFQSTAEGGILIMVVGYVSLRNSSGGVDAPRRFVQTFHLLPKEHNIFAIANDMHRFISVETESKPAPVTTNGPAVAAVEVKKEEAKPQPSPAVAAEHKPAPAPASPQQQAKGERAQRAPKPATMPPPSQPPPPPPAEKKEAPAKPTGPPSYAQAARSSPPTQSSNGVNKPAAPRAEKPKETESASASVSPRPASPPTGSSVFVKNGQAVAQQALTDAVSAISGPVLAVSLKGSGAIVTFASTKEVDAALAAKEVAVEGTTLVFEVYRGSSSRGGQRKSGGSGNAADGAKRSGGGGGSSAQQKPRDGGRSSGATSGNTSKPSQPRQSSTGSGGGKPRSGGASKPSSAAQ